MTEKELKKNNMASPNKIKNVGYDYKPFQMKAKAYGNNPVNKNFGTKEERFPSGLNFTSHSGGVGNSPNKLFGALGRMFKKPIAKIKGKIDKKLGIGDSSPKI